ncbi:SET domain-containing hypothetical protein, partial [Phytophthora megakarya]
QIECVQKTLFYGIACGNQRMQNGTQALLFLQNLPGKGVSLFADEDIENDQLIAQYVEEVVSRREYVQREKKVGRRSGRFYGMAISGDEVIDARAVGGIVRFANHCCSPNGIFERWDVGGETCCGIFAARDIYHGE